MEYDYWYNYRLELTKKINDSKKRTNEYKNEDDRRKDMIKMALDIGIKPAARYFNTTTATIRYWINKYKDM